GTGGPEHDHRAVVHRVVEGRARQHQTVEQRHRDAQGSARGDRAEHAAGRRAVQVQALVDAGVDARDHEGLPVRHEAHVAHEPFVEDGLDRLALVARAFGKPADCAARRGGGGGHGHRLHCLYHHKMIKEMIHKAGAGASGAAISGARAAEIARSIEAAIGAGQLAPGEKLPPVRALAARLGVSPATVNAAYRALRGRGLLAAAGRRGTAVRARPALRTALAPVVPVGALDLATGNPDPALLAPLRRALGRIDAAPHLYAEEHQLPALRSLARREFAADGVPAEHLAVVSGALDGIARVLEAHLRPGDRLAVEDPGFSNVLGLVAALGLEVVPVALDDRGMLPDALEGALARGVRALIATPRAQNPTGAAFDAARAAALRRVLRPQPQLLVVEDDHAGAVAGAPAYTLWERG